MLKSRRETSKDNPRAWTMSSKLQASGRRLGVAWEQASFNHPFDDITYLHSLDIMLSESRLHCASHTMVMRIFLARVTGTLPGRVRPMGNQIF